MTDRTVHARLSGVNADEVFKSVRACNGFLSWGGRGRALYQLRSSTVEIHGDNDAAELLVQVVSEDAVLDTVARLGYSTDDVRISTTEAASWQIPKETRCAMH